MGLGTVHVVGHLVDSLVALAVRRNAQHGAGKLRRLGPHRDVGEVGSVLVPVAAIVLRVSGIREAETKLSASGHLEAEAAGPSVIRIEAHAAGVMLEGQL